MRKLIATIFLCCAAFAAQAKTLTIGVDLSSSNPLLTHKNFAYVASQYVTAQIKQLKKGDVVQIKTFGARGDLSNLPNTRFKISRRLRANKVAKIVSQYLLSLPARKDVAQASTNLIAWLELTSGFNCGAGGQILAITDAIESSSVLSDQQLLQGKQALPKPDVSLKGCHLTFYGLGTGQELQAVKTLRRAWSSWAEQAGATFTAIIP